MADEKTLELILAKLGEIQESTETLTSNMATLTRQQNALEANQDLLYAEISELSKHVHSVNNRCTARAANIKAFLTSMECAGPGQQTLHTQSEYLEEKVPANRVVKLSPQKVSNKEK